MDDSTAADNGRSFIIIDFAITIEDDLFSVFCCQYLSR